MPTALHVGGSGEGEAVSAKSTALREVGPEVKYSKGNSPSCMIRPTGEA